MTPAEVGAGLIVAVMFGFLCWLSGWLGGRRK